MNMKSFLFFAVFCFCFVWSAAGDSAYSWKDENGRIHYGNRPPKDAKSISNVHSGISRYNAQKLIERVKIRPRKPAEANSILEQPLAVNGKKTITENDVLQNIEQQPVSVELDEKNSIKSCSVAIKNKSAVPINAISVVFSFPDGSKVISIGPNVLRDGEEQKFYVAQKQLPYRLNENFIKKALADNPPPEKKIELLAPKVIIGID
ncbi:MAG: DUF4124 domain-containing protein [Deltaproteobacteria bacterium]|nr:DUF4124 domain-containing protein [Deltaproteobacteria bacterium]